MSEAKSTMTHINTRLIEMINQAERILLALPTEGTKVELQTAPSKNRDTHLNDIIVDRKKDKSKKGKLQPLALSPLRQPTTQTPPRRPRNKSNNAITSSKPGKTPSKGLSKSDSSRRSATSESSGKTPKTKNPVTSTKSNSSCCRTGGFKKCSSPSQCTLAKIVPEQMKVTPLCTTVGVVVDMVVEVVVPSTLEKKQVRMEIECPQFIPARIKIDGKWKDIV